MKKDLLLEGAVAGHMNHIYDNGEMTFGELKQLLQMAADGWQIDHNRTYIRFITIPWPGVGNLFVVRPAGERLEV